MKHIILTMLLLVSLVSVSQAQLSPDQAPSFTSNPASGLTEVSSNITLLWETANANGLNYFIYLSTNVLTDQVVDADIVINNEIRYLISSPASGTYHFSVALEFDSSFVWNNVSVIFDDAVKETSETTEGGFLSVSGLWFFIMIFGSISIIRRKYQ